MRDILKEPIKFRIVVLLAVFLVGSVVIISTNYVLFDTNQNYEKLIENQGTRYHLGVITIEKLDSIEKNFLTVALLDNVKELDIYGTYVSSDILSVKQILNVLQNGGEYENILQANFGDVNEISEVHTYVRSNDEGLIVEVIDLTPKILEIEALFADLIQNVQYKFESIDESEILGYETEISLLLKQADTFI